MAINANATSLAGTGVGLGSVLGVRMQFDKASETTVLRPSVLWGVGTGAAAIILSMVMDLGPGIEEFAMDYGESALIAGTFSAFTAGSTASLPTV